MQTVTYPTGVTNSITTKAPNVTPPGELLDQAVVATRIAADQPDFAPVATLARGILDNEGNVVAGGHSNLAGKARGQFAITNGTQEIQLTGLGLKFTPVGAVLSVIHATTGKTEIRAYLIGAPTSDGFLAYLSGAVGDGTYILAYWLF